MKRLLSVLTIIAFTAIPTSTFAQDSALVLEEVVVTASKREANLQDLPMAVQAITSEELEAKNISDFNDIANLVPSIKDELDVLYSDWSFKPVPVS